MSCIFKVKGKLKVAPLLLHGSLPVLFGSIIGYLNIKEIKIYCPTPVIFLVVWAIIYLCIGLSAYRIYMIKELGENINNALFYYYVQLLLSYLWHFIFFSLRLYGVGYIELGVLLIFLIITFIKFIRLDKIAGLLIVPYILWILFVGVIDVLIWIKREM